MEVDHVIPESLLGDRDRLSEVLRDFGLPSEFNLNSFANWLPACRPCQLEKLQSIFAPSPIIQRQLQKAQDKAQMTADAAASQVSTRTISRAWATLQKAASAGELNPDLETEIKNFVQELDTAREPEAAEQPLQLVPWLTIIKEVGGIRIVKGPYGIGSAPLNPSSSFVCGSCGMSGWSGARCVFCGSMEDD